jgi:FKBP-type peptidyl-prolyl cis-trans isomerase
LTTTIRIPTRQVFLFAALCIAVLTGSTAGAAAQTREMPKDGPEVYTVRSGLKYSVLQPGNGKRHPRIGDAVTFHCSTWLADGTLCELRRTRPLRLTLGVGMPKAWTEGLLMMTDGAKYKFVAPPSLAYGKIGSPGKPPDVPGVPPNATLVLEIELVSSEKGVAIPEFQLPNLSKQKVTSSGMKFEVLREGRGKKPAKGERFTIEFTMFNERGQLVSTSRAPEVSRMVGRIGGSYGGIRFLPEAIGMMHVGEQLRLEVPAALCYGNKGKGHLVPPDSTTFWELELLRLSPAPAPRAVPEFRRLDRFKAKHTKSGLRYEIVSPGSGRRPKLSDWVEVHYVGWRTVGEPFDETFTGGIPLELPLGKTIGAGSRKLSLVQGLREGILLMPIGAVYRFAIPVSLGYGLQGLKSRGIGPNERLYFFVELVSIVNDRR